MDMLQRLLLHYHTALYYFYIHVENGFIVFCRACCSAFRNYKNREMRRKKKANYFDLVGEPLCYTGSETGTPSTFKLKSANRDLILDTIIEKKISLLNRLTHLTLNHQFNKIKFRR